MTKVFVHGNPETTAIWAPLVDAMRDRGFNVTEAVERRMHESLRWAVDKARRRGLRRLPAELVPYAGEGFTPRSPSPSRRSTSCSS